MDRSTKWVIALLFIYLLGITTFSVYMIYGNWPGAAMDEKVYNVTYEKKVSPDSSNTDSLVVEIDSVVVSSDSLAADNVEVEKDIAKIPFSERQLLVLIFFSGVLGSLLHCWQSLVAYIGNKSFKSSWALWYVARPVVGGLLAYVLYVVLRGGLVPAESAGPESINMYGFLAIVSLGGAFSSLAMERLKKVFETAFGVSSDDGNLDNSLNDKNKNNPPSGGDPSTGEGS